VSRVAHVLCRRATIASERLQHPLRDRSSFPPLAESIPGSPSLSGRVERARSLARRGHDERTLCAAQRRVISLARVPSLACATRPGGRRAADTCGTNPVPVDVHSCRARLPQPSLRPPTSLFAEALGTSHATPPQQGIVRSAKPDAASHGTSPRRRDGRLRSPASQVFAVCPGSGGALWWKACSSARKPCLRHHPPRRDPMPLLTPRPPSTGHPTSAIRSSREAHRRRPLDLSSRGRTGPVRDLPAGTLATDSSSLSLVRGDQNWVGTNTDASSDCPAQRVTFLGQDLSCSSPTHACSTAPPSSRLATASRLALEKSTYSASLPEPTDRIPASLGN